MADIFPYIATAITAFIVGAWLMAVGATAAMSHSQEWMQRKVRHWQEKAKKAESVAQAREHQAANAPCQQCPLRHKNSGRS